MYLVCAFIENKAIIKAIPQVTYTSKNPGKENSRPLINLPNKT
jgi:hypothetical protein